MIKVAWEGSSNANLSTAATTLVHITSLIVYEYNGLVTWPLVRLSKAICTLCARISDKRGLRDLYMAVDKLTAYASGGRQMPQLDNLRTEVLGHFDRLLRGDLPDSGHGQSDGRSTAEEDEDEDVDGEEE